MTGFFEDAEWSSNAGHIGHERVLYAGLDHPLCTPAEGRSRVTASTRNPQIPSTCWLHSSWRTAAWGAVAADFQRSDARAIFDPDGPLWHFLTRPRGGSKSTDQAAVLLVWLVRTAAPGEKAYIAAADKGQSKFAVLDQLERVRRPYAGAAELRHGPGRTRSSPSPARPSRSWRPIARPRTALRPSFVVCDESRSGPIPEMPRGCGPRSSVRWPRCRDCRFVVLTIAGEPVHWSFKVLKGARKSKHWHVNEVPGPLRMARSRGTRGPAALVARKRVSQYHLQRMD